MDKRNDQSEAGFAAVAAVFVLFTAMMDARVSAALSVVLLLGFAGYRLVRSRRA